MLVAKKPKSLYVHQRLGLHQRQLTLALLTKYRYYRLLRLELLFAGQKYTDEKFVIWTHQINWIHSCHASI